MAKVVVTRRTPGSYDAAGAEIVIGPDEGCLDQGALREFVASQRPVDALVTMFHDRVDSSLLEAAGDGLRIVCNFAAGYDNVDVGACREQGVIVCNTPDAVTEGTADMTWALLLGAARRLHEADAYARSSAFPQGGALGMGDFLGLDVAGRTLLIVGAGRIGFAAAMRSIGWGMRVLYVARSRHLEFEMAPLNAKRVELDEGLAKADFVSLHTPITSQTHHLIDARRLALMKSTAVLVNTSRGPVVDERALVEALREGRLFGAGLDVYEHEPELAPGLAELAQVVLTPHIGSAATKCRKMMAEIISENIRAVFAGEQAPNEVRE